MECGTVPSVRVNAGPARRGVTTRAKRASMGSAPALRGELDSVTALGQAAVPRLRDYLLNGPEPERVDRVRAHLERSHDSAQRHSPMQPLHMSKALLVQTFLGNLDAVYRARSARALREIGGDTARVALDSARHLNLRSDVLQEVQAALDSMPP
jgi:hypothetical protein